MTRGLCTPNEEDFRNNWEPLGYGWEMYEKWLSTIYNYGYPLLNNARLMALYIGEDGSLVKFPESWWEVSGDNAEMAVEWACLGFTSEEAKIYRKNGYRNPFNAKDANRTGITANFVNAANELGVRVPKNKKWYSTELKVALLSFEIMADETLIRSVRMLATKAVKGQGRFAEMYSPLVSIKPERVDYQYRAMDQVARTCFPDDIDEQNRFIEEWTGKIDIPFLDDRYGSIISFAECLRNRDQAGNFLGWLEHTRVGYSDTSTRVMILDLVPYQWYEASISNETVDHP